MEPITISPSSTKIRLKNKFLSLDILPKLGGKIASIYHINSGKECLFQKLDKQSDSPPDKESSYEPYAYGFDECFPSISPCNLNRNNRIIQISDHGNLWNSECEVIYKKKSVCLKYINPELETELSKEICLNDDSILFKYKLKNFGDSQFNYIWSAHPLLNVSEGDVLNLGSIHKLNKYWSSEELSDELKFPKIMNNHDYSVIKNRGTALKGFTHWAGSDIGIYFKETKLSLYISAKGIKALGVWLCYGGWPNKNSNILTAGLEATNISSDNILDSKDIIQRKSSKEWQMTFSFHN